MRIVSVHQGHFLPWLGYWNKCVNSDVFVWLDTVQFRKNYFQNRVLVKSGTGKAVWITVPVCASLSDRLHDVRIASAPWKRKITGTMRQHYANTPYFGEIFPGIARVIEASCDHLDELNYALFLHVLGLLHFSGVKTVKASSLPVSAENPNERLLELCRQCEATHYIAGKGGANYLDTELFARSGIGVVWQAFHDRHPTYRQVGDEFLKGLSVVDALFNVGSDSTASLIRKAWSVHESF